jgi:F-type H+-transporting ATPase subunit b
MKATRYCVCRSLASSIFVLVVSGWLVAGPGWLAVSKAADQHESKPAGHGDAHAAAAASAGHGEEHADGGPNPLVFDIDLAIWTGVVFAVLLVVLRKFAWPAITTALDEREKNISDNIAEASAKHEQAKQLLLAHEAQLAGAADQVRELMEEARRDAEHTKGQIIIEAKKSAEQESQRALRELELAKEAALHELAQKSADAAIELAGKVVREQVTPDRQAELVREALSKLTAAKPSHN